ncbi:hypothetical protein AMTRI_Chr13g123820 [Amborella trichopoda]
MADKVYPPVTPGGRPPNFTTKAKLYGATRAAYYPTAPSHRYRRSRCWSCCLWFSLIILILLIPVAVATAVFYFLYRPRFLRLFSFSLYLQPHQRRPTQLQNLSPDQCPKPQVLERTAHH